MDKNQEVIEQFGQYLAARAASNPLREKNNRLMAKHATDNDETKAFRETMSRTYGIDPLSAEGKEKFPSMKESFSWKKFRSQLGEQMSEMREAADSGTAFSNFLVAGLLQNVIGMYQLADVSYKDWVTVTPTNLVETPIAPLHGLSFPRQVGPQMPYPEVRAAGLDLKIRVNKYGSMYSIEKELLDDDQTGQFQAAAGMMGEYIQLLTEVLCYGKLQSVSAMSYAGYDVPTSETKPSYETNYPWTSSAAPLRGGGFNQPVAFGALTQANIQSGITALAQQKNLLGLIMQVSVKRILISPRYQFDLAVLLNSAYYPSGAAAAGAVGGAFSINPIKGIADVSISRYMPDNLGVFGADSKAWFLVDSSKPWFQLLVKTPVSVEQENPMSGESFNHDIRRFKTSTRINADHIDPRFAWRGSDGSV